MARLLLFDVPFPQSKMRAKGANQRSEAEPDESKHGQELYQNAGETTAAMLLISKSAGVLA
ncbi:MAG: hypothetical protein ACHP79_03035, partial [Terriglobales bacterium]